MSAKGKFKPGQRIGAYRVIRLLGEGGTGAVYEVEHEQLGVRYALKAFALDEGYIAALKLKFLTEGKVLARLQEPHLIRVFDLAVDESTGMPYFVMDMITHSNGSPRTLNDINLDECDEESFCQWFGDLCKALDYVHSQGIVHRDIKPGNVLLREDGHAVLSDFGVSRIFGKGLAYELNVTKTMLADNKSDSRLIMGTVMYIAPEVMRGEDATPASDVYSLGVMFFHLLTGVFYCEGSRAMCLFNGLRYNWEEILSQMLEKDPKKRPQSLVELSRKLTHDGKTVVRSVRTKVGLSWRGWLCAVVAGAVTAGVVFAALRLAVPKEPVNETGEVSPRVEAESLFKFDVAPGTVTSIKVRPGVTIDFVYCPAGTFTMGYADAEKIAQPRKVTITRPFWMTKRKITHRQFGGLCDMHGDDEVMSVWEAELSIDRQSFLMNDKFANLLPPGYEYRLPTEAEYEYVSKAGAQAGDPRLKWGYYQVDAKNPWGVEDMFRPESKLIFEDLLPTNECPSMAMYQWTIGTPSRFQIAELRYSAQPSKDPIMWSDVGKRHLRREIGAHPHYFGYKVAADVDGNLQYSSYYYVVAPKVESLNKFYLTSEKARGK